MTDRTVWQDAQDRLTAPGARKWYLGSLWGIGYLAIPVIIAWASNEDVVAAVLTTVLVVVIGAVYLVLPPLIWERPWPVATAALLGFLALTCLAIPLIGINTIWFWIYVPIMAAFSWQSRAFTLTALAVIVVAQVLVMSIAGQFENYWYDAAVTVSIGVMMFTFSQQIQAIARLREAQAEVARLAVVEERARFSRDMHDAIGHSLTVVTVKSELARRLVPLDSERAQAEIADIERLSRGALADLRAAVAGYREMDLSTELSVARAALAAAEIEAHLPPSGDVAAPELRELFGWGLRECVTNMIRHSGARQCWVEITRTRMSVEDDGRGFFSTGSGRSTDALLAAGHGLTGLVERAHAGGVDLRLGSGRHGGACITMLRRAA